MFGLGVNSSLGGTPSGSRSLLGPLGRGAGVPKSGPLNSGPFGRGDFLKPQKPAHIDAQVELTLELLKIEQANVWTPSAKISAAERKGTAYPSLPSTFSQPVLVDRHVVGESDDPSVAHKVTTHLNDSADTSAISASSSMSAEARAAQRRGALPPDPEDQAATIDTAAARSAPAIKKKTNPDPDPSADWDFDFSGNGRPYRLARGKATRLLSGAVETLAGREAVRHARMQLRGATPMEMAVSQGSVRHVGPCSAFASLGECGHPDCGGHRIFRPGVRARFQDFIVDWVNGAPLTAETSYGKSGLRYTSLGSGQLLFDLELLERLRAKGVCIGQICLIDKEYQQPDMAMRRVFREFADWQRAVSLLDREVPPEILIFGHLADYHEVACQGGAAAGCHLFVHCDAHWENVLQDCDRLARQALAPGGLLARLNPNTLLHCSTQSTDAAQIPTHSDAPFGVAAWLLAPGRRLQYLEDPLLQRCVEAVEALNASPPGDDVLSAQRLAREEMRLSQNAKTKHLDEVAETKRVEAEVIAHNRRVDAQHEEMQAQQDKLARAKSRKNDIIRIRQDRGRYRKSRTQSASQKSPEQRRAWILELEEKGWSLWRVVQEEKVGVHVTPKANSRTVAVLSAGTEVVVGQVYDEWLQILEDPEDVELPIEAWVRHDDGAAGHRVMLRRVQAKDLEDDPVVSNTVNAPRVGG